MGDAAGIGPEVIAKAVCDPNVLQCCRPLVIGHPELLVRCGNLLPTVGEVSYACLPMNLCDRQTLEKRLAVLPPDQIPIINPTSDDVLTAPTAAVSAAAGDAAYACLTTAIPLARSGAVDAIATAPLNKEALQAAGHAFPGHTEILAEECGVSEFSMMLHLPESRLAPLRQLIASPPRQESIRTDVSHGLSIAHVTLHTSVASVPSLLTQESVTSTTRLMRDFLSRLGSCRQTIAVAALNPHGGEQGLFGDEESTIIAPAVKKARAAGCNVTGPLPVDTLIRRAVGGEFDGVVAMYHDQGHIPVKLLGFDSALNITLGLPIVRTSPTHGTAFDRAWNPETPADPGGMIESIITAAQFCRSRL